MKPKKWTGWLTWNILEPCLRIGNTLGSAGKFSWQAIVWQNQLLFKYAEIYRKFLLLNMRTTATWWDIFQIESEIAYKKIWYQWSAACRSQSYLQAPLPALPRLRFNILKYYENYGYQKNSDIIFFYNENFIWEAFCQKGDQKETILAKSLLETYLGTLLMQKKFYVLKWMMINK